MRSTAGLYLVLIKSYLSKTANGKTGSICMSFSGIWVLTSVFTFVIRDGLVCEYLDIIGMKHAHMIPLKCVNIVPSRYTEEIIEYP